MLMLVFQHARLFVVVAQAYKVEVEVLGASRGCTAILRCVVPTFVKELVRVVSWVQEPALYIYPSLQGGNQCARVGEIVRTDMVRRRCSTLRMCVCLIRGNQIVRSLDFRFPFHILHIRIDVFVYPLAIA